MLATVTVPAREPAMSTPVEKRLDELEKKVADLTRLIAAGPKDPYAWRSTVGMSANDPGFDEMVRLGKEYRQSLKAEDEPDADPRH
jgi:hypothetical protein